MLFLILAVILNVKHKDWILNVFNFVIRHGHKNENGILLSDFIEILPAMDFHIFYTVAVALLLVANNSAYAYLGLAV